MTSMFTSLKLHYILEDNHNDIHWLMFGIIHRLDKDWIDSNRFEFHNKIP